MHDPLKAAKQELSKKKEFSATNLIPVLAGVGFVLVLLAMLFLIDWASLFKDRPVDMEAAGERVAALSADEKATIYAEAAQLEKRQADDLRTMERTVKEEQYQNEGQEAMARSGMMRGHKLEWAAFCKKYGVTREAIDLINREVGAAVSEEIARRTAELQSQASVADAPSDNAESTQNAATEKQPQDKMKEAPNRPPTIELQTGKESDLLAGQVLQLEVASADPEGDAVSIEYRIGPDDSWVRAESNQIRLTELPVGTFKLDVRAVDGRGALSDVVSRSYSVAENPWHSWTALDPIDVHSESLTAHGWVGFKLVGRNPNMLMLTGPEERTLFKQLGDRGIRRPVGYLIFGPGKIDVTPDGARAAAGAVRVGQAETAAYIYSPANAKPIHTLEGHTERVELVRFSPDGSLLATAANGDPVFVWNVKSGQQVTSLRAGQTDRRYIVDQQFSADGKLLILAFANGPAEVWSVSEGRLLGEACLGRTILLHPDGTRMLCNESGQMHIAEIPSGKTLHTIEASYRHGFTTAAFTPGGEFFATFDQDRIRIWNTSSGQAIHEIPTGSTIQVTSITFNAEGTALAAFAQNQIWIWRGPQVEVPSSVEQTTPDWASRIWSSADGRFKTPATLVEFDADSVTLRREDGKTVRVERKQLSADDHAYLESQSEK